MIYKLFSILTVPFPFTDSLKSKRRPALVLSAKEFQAHTGHVTLLMITSAMHTSWFGDHKILDLNKTGLTRECIVRQKLFTIDLRLIINEIGQLSSEDINCVLQKIKEHFKTYPV